MKNLLLIIFLITFSYTNSQTSIPRFVKLTQAEIKFLEENYNWKTEKLLILNIRLPRIKCQFDNYADLKTSKVWWNNFYNKVNLNNAANRFIYSDVKRVKKVIDSKIYFIDKDNYILNEFFSKDRVCFGIVIINKFGEFKYKAGEYSEADVNSFISELLN